MAFVVRRPVMLDLYCCAGGAARGYHDAGFDVIGIDNQPQPRYPYEFHQSDALAFLDATLKFGWSGIDFIHASPPCRDHTPLTSVAGTDGSGWLLDATRDRLDAIDLPWVIENVPGSPMRPDLKLCGCMFGLRTYRLRWFEFSHQLCGMVPQPAHGSHSARTATKRRLERWRQGWNVSVTGDVGVYVGLEAMGIDWMTGNELSQAVPVPYTDYIGRYVLPHLDSRTVVAA